MKKKKTKSMLVLGLLLLGITVGYAILSTNLNINGTSTINKPTWDIHFENIVVKSGSVTPSTAANITNATTVTYAVTFDTPGQFYEFNVDVKNAGTIDGMIESVTSTVNGQPISSLPSYVEYFVTYSDGVEIQDNHLLTAGAKETYTVHIGFSRDIDPGDLPSTAQTYNLSFEFTETQATSDATKKPVYYYAVPGGALHIGVTIPTNSPYIFDNYNDAINFLGVPVFFRCNTENKKIIETSLGFVHNNEVYYLPWAENGASYNANKQIMLDAFGSSYCSETNEGSYMQYMCTYNTLRIRIQSNGTLSGSNKNTGSGCATSTEGSMICGG